VAGSGLLHQIVRKRLHGRVREHIRPGGKRAAHGVRVESVRGDAQAQAVRLVGHRARHLRVEHGEAPVEGELDETDAGFGKAQDGRAPFGGRGELQAVAVRSPALRRIAARRGQERAGETHPQRRSGERERPLGLAEIEHRRHSSAELGRGDLGDASGDREVHVRVDEGGKQEQAARVDRPLARGRFRRLAGDPPPLDGQGGRARGARIEQAAARDPQLCREEQRPHLPRAYSNGASGSRRRLPRAC